DDLRVVAPCAVGAGGAGWRCSVRPAGGIRRGPARGARRANPGGSHRDDRSESVGAVLVGRTRWPPRWSVGLGGCRVGVWIQLFRHSRWTFDANLTPCCGYRGITSRFSAEISTEPCQAIRHCPDIHNTGVWILCGLWKIFTYPHSVETPVVEPEPFRSLVDAGWMTRPPARNGRLTPLRATPPQASSPKIRSPTRPPPHRRQSLSSQAKRGIFPSEGRP